MTLQKAKKVELMTDELIWLSDKVNDAVEASTRLTDSQLKYLKAVQSDSINLWTFVGSVVVALFALRIAQRRWNFWELLKQRRRTKVELNSKRLHARQWEVAT